MQDLGYSWAYSLGGPLNNLICNTPLFSIFLFNAYKYCLWSLYLFLVAAVTNYLKLSGLKWIINFLKVLESRSLKSVSLSQNEGISRASSTDSGRKFVPWLSGFRCLLSLLCLWSHHTDPCLSLHHLLFCVPYLPLPSLSRGQLGWHLGPIWIVQDCLLTWRPLI